MSDDHDPIAWSVEEHSTGLYGPTVSARITSERMDPSQIPHLKDVAATLNDEGVDASAQEMLRHYSAALDEIHRLRGHLAYEAAVTRAHLALKSFPKSRRGIAEEQDQRMRASARGERRSTAALDSRSLRLSLWEAGAEETLTRGAWEGRA